MYEPAWYSLKFGVFLEVKIVVPMALRIFNKVAKHYKWTVFVIILFNIGSIVVSIVQKDFNWLAASGGVTSIVGLLLTVSHSVPKTEVDVQNYVAAMFPKSRDGIMADPPKNRGVICSSQTGHLAKRHFAFQSSLGLGTQEHCAFSFDYNQLLCTRRSFGASALSS